MWYLEYNVWSLCGSPRWLIFPYTQQYMSSMNFVFVMGSLHISSAQLDTLLTQGFIWHVLMKCRSQGTSTSQLMSNQELLSCKYLFPRTHFHSQYQEDSTITNEYLVFLDTILKLRLGFGVTSQHSHLFYHAITLCFSKAYMNSVTVFFPGTTLNLKAKINKKK